MSDGLNDVTLAGNLAAEAELRFGQGPDTAVLRFRLACNESYFDKRTNERKEKCEFVPCILFGKRAEALQKILTKGQFVVVKGSFTTSSWEKDGVKQYRSEVRVREVVLTGGRRDIGDRPSGGSSERPAFNRDRPQGFGGAGGGSSSNRNPEPNDFGGYGDQQSGDDDIPF